MVGSIAAKTVLVVVTLVLLVSMGGAIFASPILLPLLFIAAVRSGRPGRVAFSLLGAVVAAEAVWALVYVLAGEAAVLIWAVPMIAFCGVGAGFFYVSGIGLNDEPVAHNS